MKGYYLLLTLLTAFVCNAAGQTHNFDTIVDHKFYSFVDYYDNGRIKALGNYNDTLKSGEWIYFNRKGDKLAYGIYRENYKFETWTYFNKREIFRVKWTEKNKPRERFEFDAKGNLILIDIIYAAPCFHVYRNGMPTMTARTL